MDISTFRWILIIMGVAIIAGIFLLGNPDKKKQRRASRKRRRKQPKSARSRSARRQEPTLGGAASTEDSTSAMDASAPQGELSIDALDAGPPPPPVDPPDKIVTLYLRARDNHKIGGLDLLDSALKSGMVFGQHDIFHREVPGGDKPLFSMANLTNPGTFDKETWSTLETKGVTLFMTLPGPLGALDSWDAMLATARRLAELMHADLLDDSREVFTRQKEGEVRETLREYERQKRPGG